MNQQTSNQVLCKHCSQPILSRKDLTIASINTTPHPFHKPCYVEAKENGDWKTNLTLGQPINSIVMRQPYSRTLIRICVVMLAILAFFMLFAFTLGGVYFSMGNLVGLSTVFIVIFLAVFIPLGALGYFFQKRIWNAIDEIESRLPEEHQ